jgi:hypothetical protein
MKNYGAKVSKKRTFGFIKSLKFKDKIKITSET